MDRLTYPWPIPGHINYEPDVIDYPLVLARAKQGFRLLTGVEEALGFAGLYREPQPNPLPWRTELSDGNYMLNVDPAYTPGSSVLTGLHQVRHCLSHFYSRATGSASRPADWVMLDEAALRAVEWAREAIVRTAEIIRAEREAPDSEAAPDAND